MAQLATTPPAAILNNPPNVRLCSRMIIPCAMLPNPIMMKAYANISTQQLYPQNIKAMQIAANKQAIMPTLFQIPAETLST